MTKNAPSLRATERKRGNPLLIKLNFKIEFYFNWITSDFVLVMTINYRHCERSEAKARRWRAIQSEFVNIPNNNGFSHRDAFGEPLACNCRKDAARNSIQGATAPCYKKSIILNLDYFGFFKTS